MKRKILIPFDDANELEVNRINEEVRRMEEEAEALRERREAEARLQEARSRRDLEQRRLQRIVGNNNVQISSGGSEIVWTPYDPPTNTPRWGVLGATVGAHDELIELNEPKQEKPEIKLQHIATGEFVFAWENSSSVEEFVEKYHEEITIEAAQEVAKCVRSVETIPLRELPDKRSTVKRGRIQNFS